MLLDTSVLDFDALLALARTAARLAHPAELLGDIDAALETTSDARTEAYLHLARAVAGQFGPDPSIPARSARRAAAVLTELGTPEAAYAHAVLAVLEKRAGGVPAAVDAGVDGIMLLEGSTMRPQDEVHTTSALASLFFEMSAYEQAIDLAERALDTSIVHHIEPIENAAFACGYIAIESIHAQWDPAEDRIDRTSTARRAADILTTFGADRVSRKLMGNGLLAELALFDDDVPAASSLLVAGRACYGDAAAMIVAWHRLITASAALRAGDHGMALSNLDRAVPVLMATNAPAITERALRLRATTRREVGLLDEALDDAMQLADLTARMRSQQIVHLFDQIDRVASLERDRSDLTRRADELLDELARDAITRVHTRRWLEARLDELSTAPHDAVIAVIMLDLDRFKAVNDTYGHGVGDAILASFGELLQVMAPTAAVARFGGEEFVVLIDGGVEVAVDIAERLRRATSDRDWTVAGPDLRLTMSAGISVGPARQGRDVMASADAALLTAKRDGRDRIALAG